MTEEQPSGYVPPRLGAPAFSCPHCMAFAQQAQLSVQAGQYGAMRTYANLTVTRCASCHQDAIWHGMALIHPRLATAPLPNPDLPPAIAALYLEAREIEQSSPRASAALLRLCIERVCTEVGAKGTNLNQRIGDLVQRGVPPEVQQALDYTRLIGNEAVHPGQISETDTDAIAAPLFTCVNLIADALFTRPRQMASLYHSLPQSSRDQIDRRDTSGS